MKTNLIILFGLLCTGLLAQERPVEARRSMSLGNYPSFAVTIRNMDAKTVEDVWKDYLKDTRGSNPKKKKSEYFVDDARMRDISDNTVDIYSTVEKNGNDTEVTVWFDLGGAYLSSENHSEKIPQLNKWFADFGDRIETKRVELELKAEEDKLSGLNKEFEKLQKDQEKLTQSIEDYKRRIEEAEQALIQNADAQKQRQDEIAAQQETVQKVKQRLKKQ